MGEYVTPCSPLTIAWNYFTPRPEYLLRTLLEPILKYNPAQDCERFRRVENEK